MYWVECVRHGSTRTTITFRSRRQSSRFFFCWKAIDMMHLFTCFTQILDTNSVFTAEWSWKKQKWASAARAFAHARIWSFQSHQWMDLVTPNRRNIHIRRNINSGSVFSKSHQFAVHQDVQLEEAQSPHYFSHHAFFAIVVSAIVCVSISSSQRTQTRRVKTSSHARERGTRVNLIS